jgi:hypothetical protein
VVAASQAMKLPLNETGKLPAPYGFFVELFDSFIMDFSHPLSLYGQLSDFSAVFVPD